MFTHAFAGLLVLPAILRTTVATEACNNSPNLCSKAYNDVSYLGAHDSPFIRDAANDYDVSGNQYYNTSVQLSAGVRLVSAQVQESVTGNQLHVCHTSCELFDAGPLSTWLSEVNTWMDSNPDEVVTIILVNGAGATASELAAQYAIAGITSSRAYAPNGSTAKAQAWPTLKEMIDSGKRLVNFVDAVDPDDSYPWIINQETYVFENNYNNNAPTDYSCDCWESSIAGNDTQTALDDALLPLMNHFLYIDFLGIQMPNASYADVTNAASGGVGNLGTSANECKSQWGELPTFILVDFFNVGPAIATVDDLNDVTDPVGRTNVSTATPTETSLASIPPTPSLALSAALSVVTVALGIITAI